MSLSPDQMRKKAMAEQESLRHARYAQADGSMREGRVQSPPMSREIERSERKIQRIADEERKLIGGENASPNDGRY